MKKKILVLMVGCLLIGVNLYAAGDLIVEGKIGIGTTSPDQLLHISGANNVTNNVGIKFERQDNAKYLFFDWAPAGSRTPENVGWGMGLRANSNHFQYWTWDGSVENTPLTITNTGNVSVDGDFSATGSKNFEIDHPTKEGMKLVHSSLEGPEIAVFYRAETQLENGEAIIELPEYFEALTRKEGRTVQLTAKGTEPYLLSYTDIVNGEFTVYGTKLDGEFSWEVKAVRADIEPLKVERPKEEEQN